MKGRDNRTNHSNQMNPNNDAYWQARGYNERPGDWEDQLPTHCSPNTSRFMAEFRLKASTDMAHHAALAPNSPDGSRRISR